MFAMGPGGAAPPLHGVVIELSVVCLIPILHTAARVRAKLASCAAAAAAAAADDDEGWGGGGESVWSYMTLLFCSAVRRLSVTRRSSPKLYSSDKSIDKLSVLGAVFLSWW